jgi:2-O-(6-phospho-alpha-D-mannosyl)-D-glycerate hydrolase
VRNLLAGRRTLRSLRADAPRVLYCPDSFGHPAALPELARGFDTPLVILWRGFGGPRSPKGNAFLWVAPSGETVLVHHLSRSGYELGANLPSEAELARARWHRIRNEIGTRAACGIELLLNGADHHARQRDLDQSVSQLTELAKPDLVIPSSLSRFASELEQRAADATLPRIQGELRDSYGYTWTLQGTFASRTPQKRRYILGERELLRDVEPWLALLALDERPSRRHLLAAAWREVLLCQPHDTLCGCSIDQVARAMDYRLENAGAQASGLREDAILDLVGHDRDAARLARGDWKPSLIVRNRAPRRRSGVAIVELTSWIADVPAGPGSSTPSRPDIVLPPPPKLGGTPVQVLGRAVEHDRTEAPRAYPDNDEVLRAQAAIWVDDVPALGLDARPFGKARSARLKARPVVVAKDGLSNGRLHLRIEDGGSVTLEQDGRVIPNFLHWESHADVGDLYTPAIRDEKLTPRLIATRIPHRGPLRGAIEQRWRLLGKEGRIDLRLRFILDAEANWLRIHILGENAARDHRLRLRFVTDVSDGATFADAAFGSVLREAVHVPLEDALVELPIQTAPLHRYVSLFNRSAGATVFSDGLTEYESTDGVIALTLLRSVGELSRNDLPERPGNAGWPASTPDAQCLGNFEAELAVMLHGPRSTETIDEIERAADDVLFPLVGETLRSALRVPEPRHGIELQGAGLSFSSAKESDDGQWTVLRCVNLTEQEVRGAWKVPRTLREAHLARLDETPTGPVSVLDDTVRFRAPPRAVVTVLVR